MKTHLRILDFALGTLLRNAGKTLVVIVVYSLLVGLVASLLLYVGALRNEARRLLDAAPEIVVQKVQGGRQELIPAEWRGPAEQIRGVTEVRPRVWGYVFDPATGATLTLWGADSVPRDSLELVEGHLPGEGARDVCVVGLGVATIRLLDVGDRLPLLGSGGQLHAPRITGIFTADSALLTNDLVVLGTSELRTILGMRPGEATDLALRVGNPLEVATVARKIQEALPGARPVTRRQILQTYDAAFEWRGGLWLAILASSIAAFGILVWDKATGLSADEYRTIGILRALGWSPRNVLELKAWEGGIVSAISLATGLVFAQIHLVWFDGAVFSRILRGWSAFSTPLALKPDLDAYVLLLCLPLAVAPYVAASLVPAWRAAITDPDRVMRS